jgi:hypothetical protein
MAKWDYYGRPNRYWRGNLSRFFPPDEPLSPSVLGFLLRADEIRRVRIVWDDEVPV